MSMNMVQTVFDGFSSPALYMALAWFGVVGYLAVVCVVMLLTRLSFKQVMWPVAMIHVQSLAFAYVLTPVARMFYIFMIQVLFLQNSDLFVNLGTYNLFCIFVMGRLPMVLHRIFVQATLKKWNQSITIATLLLMFLGVFCLKINTVTCANYQVL